MLTTNLVWSRDISDLLVVPIHGLRMAHATADHRIHIEIRYLFDVIARAGLKRRRNDWVTERFANLHQLGIPPEHCTRGTRTVGELAFDTVSVFGCLLLFMDVLSGANATKPVVQTTLLQSLHSVAGAAAAHLASLHGHPIPTLHIAELDTTLVITPGGRIEQFGAMVSVIPGMIEVWRSLQRPNPCGVSLLTDVATPSLQDAFTFLAMVPLMLPPSSRSRIDVMRALEPMVPYVASLFQARLYALVDERGPAASSPLPPVIFGNGRPSLIDPNSGFHLIERARALGSVPTEVLRFNNDRPEYIGLTHHVADLWFRRELDMWHRNLKQAFSCVRRFSMACDPSSYNGEETMVSQVYSAWAGMSANALIQIIPASRRPAVTVDMSDYMAALILRRKNERYASFKEMRAISAQIADISSGA